MPLDFSSLGKSIQSLTGAVAISTNKEIMKELPPAAEDAIRSGVIQNFEFTYELCWKFMKRWLGENLGHSYVDGVPRRELFRLAAENLLIDNVDQWMDYHLARNRTAHTYDENTAREIYELALIFLTDARKLLRRLEERNV